jgi:hypothetical protein
MPGVAGMVERVFGQASYAEGVAVCEIFIRFFKTNMAVAKMMPIPTLIDNDDSFQEFMSIFLNDFVQLLTRVYHFVTRDDENRPQLLAKISPNECRWLGGKKKNAVGVVALSLCIAGGSESLPTLYIVCSPNYKIVSHDSPKSIYLQFQGKNAWPDGKGVADEGSEYFYHIGRPEYQFGNANECPYDIDALCRAARVSES